MPPKSSRPSTAKSSGKKEKNRSKKNVDNKNNDDEKVNDNVEEVNNTTPASFEDLDFVDQCLQLCRDGSKDPSVLESFLAERMQLPMYKVDLRQSVLLDFYTYSIEFAAKEAFNAEKASALLIVMQHLMRAIVEMDGNSDQIEPIVQILKDQMLPYCSKREVQVEKKPPSPTPEELAAEAKKKKKRGSSAKKSKKSGRKDTAEDDQQQIEYETVIRPPLFSVSEVRQVSQFALQTLVQHWQLYRYVFNQSQARSLFKYTEFLEQPMPPLELKTAIDKTTWEQQKEQEKMEMEEAERRKREEEEEKRRIAQEEERLRLEREEEERNAPKLTRDDLQEIAQYLKYHITRDVDEKREEMVERIAELQKKIEVMGNAKPSSGKKKK